MLFRMADGSVMLYDSFLDEKKLYEKALEKIDKKSKTTSEWIGYRLRLQDASKKDISIQQYKSDIKKILADER